MSELKVIKSYVPTFDGGHNDMLLVSHTRENYVPAKQIECYLKSEADKEIAELKERIEVLEHQACKMNCITVKLYNEACDDLIHQKYKRCLAMAERWLFAFYVTNKCNDKFYLRSLKYRKLAEKLKEGFVIGVDKAIGTDKTVVINYKEAK